MVTTGRPQGEEEDIGEKISFDGDIKALRHHNNKHKALTFYCCDVVME